MGGAVSHLVSDMWAYIDPPRLKIGDATATRGGESRARGSAMAASTAEAVRAELARLPELKAMVLTDGEGVVLLHAGDAALEGPLQQMAATFAQTAESANKLGLGRNRHVTGFYGAAMEMEIQPA